MRTVADLMSGWPSMTAFAADFGLPVQTVSSWKARGSIPGRYWQPMVASAERREIEGVTLEALAKAHAINLPLQSDADLDIPAAPGEPKESAA